MNSKEWSEVTNYDYITVPEGLYYKGSEIFIVYLPEVIVLKSIYLIFE